MFSIDVFTPPFRPFLLSTVDVLDGTSITSQYRPRWYRAWLDSIALQKRHGQHVRYQIQLHQSETCTCIFNEQTLKNITCSSYWLAQIPCPSRRREALPDERSRLDPAHASRRKGCHTHGQVIFFDANKTGGNDEHDYVPPQNGGIRSCAL